MLKKIIIIDDEPINCFIVEQLCKKLAIGEDFFSYSDSNQALELLKETNVQDMPELLFIDLNMPIVSGWELLDQLREKLNLAKSKVVILTSSMLDEDKIKAEKDPLIFSYLIKPIDINAIKTITKDLV